MSQAGTTVMTPPPPGMTVIVPPRGWQGLAWRELWQFRELVGFLTWRDIAVRYKQTAIGVLWALLQPLAMMLVFTLFFGTLARIPSEGVPYPLFAYAGLLPWQMFSRALGDSANSLVSNQRVITRVYFPRLIVPLASTLAALVDVAVASVLLVAMMTWYGLIPSATILWLPLFVGLLLMTAVGIGCWLSALNIEFRDVQYLLPFLTQLWLFLTPVVYPSSMVPERWRLLYALNPMVGVVEGFRWALFGTGAGPGPMLAVSAAVALGGCVSGVLFFRMRERVFADVVGSGGR